MTAGVEAVANPAPSDAVVLCCAVAAGALLAAAFAPTVRSIVGLWSTSDTFAHGWFVLPLCAWLVWRRRDRFRPDRPYRLDPRALIALLACGALWLLSRAAGVQVGEQAGFVGLLIAALALVLGRGLSRELRFALVMLAFLAPVGAELVPVLMELTADLTVGAIRLTGIPVYREGLYFSIPSGNWSVVEACSGVRYLIASLMLGALYSGLYLHGWRQRATFLALSLAVPIAANAVRAFGIVMLGHFSGNKLATGADHLLYGWVFFGIVMFCLFAIGARFPDRSERAEGARRSGGPAADDVPRDRTRRPRRALALGVAGCLLAGGAFPAWAGVMDRNASRLLADVAGRAWLPPAFTARDVPVAPEGAAGASVAQGGDWAPEFTGHDAFAVGETDGPAPVTARAYVYAEQRQGKELISSSNRLIGRDADTWREIATAAMDVRPAPADAPSLRVTQSTLDGPDGRLLVWRWNAVRGHHTSDPVRGKLEELAGRLTLDARPSVGYVLSVDASAPEARQALREAALAIVAAPAPAT